MKVKTFILVAALFFICPVLQQAQSFTTGISLGGSTTSLDITKIPGNTAISTINGSSISGFEAGFMGRLNLGPVFIKPMVLVSYQSGILNFINTNGTVNTPNFDYGTVEIPILFGIRFLKVLRIEGGPVYNWIYTSQYSSGTSVAVQPSGWGYRIGLNVEFSRINLGFAYQGINNTSSSGSSISNFSTPNELIFSLGINFGKIL